MEQFCRNYLKQEKNFEGEENEGHREEKQTTTLLATPMTRGLEALLSFHFEPLRSLVLIHPGLLSYETAQLSTMPRTNQMLAEHLMNFLNPHAHRKRFLPAHSVALQEFLKNSFRQLRPCFSIN